MAKLTYRSSGLNLDLYEEGIAAIGPLARRTHSPRVLDGFGGFASLFSLENDPGRFAKNYQKPLLVTCTDGVGTKIHVAIQMNRHDTVGIDLVAMSVNDALCTGAQPLIFLDYVCMPEDNPTLLTKIVRGIAAGCEQAGCSLVGGETAIHPGDLEPGHYDLAGFCVGVVERDEVVTGAAIKPGDVILGLASTGLHSNGYSLARKVVFEHAQKSVGVYEPALGRTIGEALLEPTKIYVKPVMNVLANHRAAIHGLAHVTGGGLVDNIPRVLPAGCQAVLTRQAWPLPPIIPFVQGLGDVAQEEMDRVFNNGIGFVVIADASDAPAVQDRLEKEGCSTFAIGRIESGNGDVVFA